MKKDGTPTKREVWLGLAKNAGYHEDARLWVRVLVESRGVKREDLNAAYAKGRALKAAGAVCGCYYCKREVGVA